jgi:hypothetical protein
VNGHLQYLGEEIRKISSYNAPKKFWRPGDHIRVQLTAKQKEFTKVKDIFGILPRNGLQLKTSTEKILREMEKKLYPDN